MTGTKPHCPGDVLLSWGRAIRGVQSLERTWRIRSLSSEAWGPRDLVQLAGKSRTHSGVARVRGAPPRAHARRIYARGRVLPTARRHREPSGAVRARRRGADRDGRLRSRSRTRIPRRRGFRCGGCARSWRAVVRVPLDTGLLCREAVAQLTQPKRTRGQFRAVPFKAGTSERDRGRYALTEIVGSLAPNTIVIGVDADSDLLLVHQLRRHGDRHDIDVLELG